MLVQLSKHFGKSPEEVTTEELKDYLYYCRHTRGLSNSYIKQVIGSVKILREDVLGLPWDTDLKVKYPRKEDRLPEIISRSQAIKLIASPANIKHKAILAVLYSSGIRLDELIHLKLCDIDSRRMLIRVADGKGKKSRDTLLAEKTLNLLREYYKYYHPTTYLFEAGWNPGKPYSASSVRKIVKKAASKTGIKKNLSPHSLRHAFATHMLEQGANLKLIQKLLGHTSLRSTMVYLHMAKIDPSIKSPFDLP